MNASCITRMYGLQEPTTTITTPPLLNPAETVDQSRYLAAELANIHGLIYYVGRCNDAATVTAKHPPAPHADEVVGQRVIRM